MGRGQTVRLVNPSAPDFASFIRENAGCCTAVAQRGSAKGRSLGICGAGPSLAENATALDTDDVWAINSALGWMAEHGHRVTHGFTVNSLDAALWLNPPAIPYLVASSTHPAIVGRLLEAGRQVTVFHNLIELREQDQLYTELYPPTVLAGAGLNAVTRAIDVARFMGYGRIDVLGADCAFRGDAIHVTGAAPNWEHAVMEATIDGRLWRSTADMWISANWLTRFERAGCVRLVGDTLPVALRSKSLAYLDRLPHSVDGRNRRIPIVV